jgi:type I restriction enzyme S subunit
MDRSQLLQQFETLVETPEAVAKLRAAMLDLAVRGRLVPHAGKPDKDPAWLEFCTELEDKAESNSDPSPPAFDILQHWHWAFLQQVAEPCGQRKPNARFTYVDVGAIDNLRGVITPDVRILEADEAPSRARKLVRAGSVIYSTVRPYLRNIAVVDQEFDPPAIVSTAFAVLHPKPILDARFLFHWLRSGPFQNDVAAKIKGVAYPAISDSEFWQCRIPVPPPAEQQRIVAKVEELLALCDELEARQQATRERRTRLVHSALDHLTAAKDEQDFRKQCSFILHNSSLVLDSVTSLRQAILSLAAQGRLVPQNQEDEPAPALLAKVRKTKQWLAESAGEKPPKDWPKVEPDEMTFDLPDGWVATRFGSLAANIEAGSSPQCEGRPKTKDEWGVLKISAVSWDEFDPDENKALPANVEPRTEYEVQNGDFIMSRANTAELVAKSVVTNNPPPRLLLNDKTLRVHFTEYTDKRFLNMVNNSSVSRAYYAKAASGTSSSMKNISREGVSMLPIALPPLAEQQRIVAKVDELMRWCDALESRLSAAQTTATHLLDATLDRALKGEL